MKKKNLALIISAAALIVVGLIALLVGYILQGADILAWFRSKYFAVIAFAVGIYVLLVLAIVIYDKVRSL